MLLTDTDIRFFATQKGMIEPFAVEQVRTKDDKPIVSYGLSSFGYDARLDNEILAVDKDSSGIIDPKRDVRDCFTVAQRSMDDGGVIVPPLTMCLGQTVEYFKIPQNIIALCVGKSTYARCGLIVNVTPLEPGWEGHVTLELSNTTPLPIVIYPGEGICQFIFHEGNVPEVTYSKRSGKYMYQREVTLPRV